MAAFAAGPPMRVLRVRKAAADLAQEPEATRWARDCAWVPGTGYCRRRDCGHDCLFRAQRAAEVQRLHRWRRLRRLFGSRDRRAR